MQDGMAESLGPEPVRPEIDQPEVMPMTRKVAILLFDEFENSTLSAQEVFSILIFQLALLRTAATKDAIHDRVHQAVELADAAISKGLIVHPRTQEMMLLATHEQAEASPEIVRELTDLVIPDDASSLFDDMPDTDPDGTT